MSKIFNLEEARKKFGGFIFELGTLTGTGYKSMIYAHCEDHGLTWCITAANVDARISSPYYVNVSEETHIIQYRISNNSISPYVDGVRQGIIFVEDMPKLDSCRDGEGYYNADNIIAPDFWGGSVKKILSQCVNDYFRMYYNLSHKKHTI